MPTDQVAPQAGAQGHGALEVEAVARPPLGERRAAHGLGHDVGGEAARAETGHGEAHTVGEQTVADGGPLEHRGGGDVERRAALADVEAAQCPDLLDDAREHAGVSSPTWPASR